MGLTGGFGKLPRYCAQERKWVRQLLCRMTKAEREEYERRCAYAPHHHRSGKLYDGMKAQIAEQVMLEMRRGGLTPQ